LWEGPAPVAVFRSAADSLLRDEIGLISNHALGWTEVHSYAPLSPSRKLFCASNCASLITSKRVRQMRLARELASHAKFQIEDLVISM